MTGAPRVCGTAGAWHRYRVHKN